MISPRSQIEFGLASRIVPESDEGTEAGRLVRCLSELWAAADLTEPSLRCRWTVPGDIGLVRV